MKISLIVLLLLSSVIAQDRFGKLYEMKQSSQHVNVKKQSQKDICNKLLEIKYFDINNLDTDYLEKQYSLYLEQCIADGICIFKYNGEVGIQQLVHTIRENEKMIRSVRKYQKYNFKKF